MPRTRRSLQEAAQVDTAVWTASDSVVVRCLESTGTGGTFLKTRMIAMVLACCTTMAAQISNYLGPGVLSRGAGDIGTRAGQDVSLRFFVNAQGIFDNGIQPFSLDSTGHLATVDGLWGTEVSAGVY